MKSNKQILEHIDKCGQYLAYALMHCSKPDSAQEACYSEQMDLLKHIKEFIESDK